MRPPFCSFCSSGSRYRIADQISSSSSFSCFIGTSDTTGSISHSHFSYGESWTAGVGRRETEYQHPHLTPFLVTKQPVLSPQSLQQVARVLQRADRTRDRRCDGDL